VKPSDFTVGQRLWYVPDASYGNPHAEVVVQIGRKWVTTVREGEETRWHGNKHASRRFDPATMREDCGRFSSHSIYYLGEDDYYLRRELNRAWSDLRYVVDKTWSCPSHLTASDIAELTSRIKGLED